MYGFLSEGVVVRPRPRKKPRVLFGLAATGIGYALGGLPGAAIGAAAALLKGRLDETRVG